jgi:hypothetical protein
MPFPPDRDMMPALQWTAVFRRFFVVAAALLQIPQAAVSGRADGAATSREVNA